MLYKDLDTFVLNYFLFIKFYREYTILYHILPYLSIPKIWHLIDIWVDPVWILKKYGWLLYIQGMQQYFRISEIFPINFIKYKHLISWSSFKVCSSTYNNYVGRYSQLKFNLNKNCHSIDGSRTCMYIYMAQYIAHKSSVLVTWYAAPTCSC